MARRQPSYVGDEHRIEDWEAFFAWCFDGKLFFAAEEEDERFVGIEQEGQEEVLPVDEREVVWLHLGDRVKKTGRAKYEVCDA